MTRRSISPAPSATSAFLAAGGVALKLETDGSRIDDVAADRIAALGVDCVQISVDGATAATHERMRPGNREHGAQNDRQRVVRGSFGSTAMTRFALLAKRGMQ